MSEGDLQLLLTRDGSHTLYSPSLNEIYHSRNGALTESRHVFIENGLKQCAGDSLRVFEMGFGTGLNALLTLQQALSADINIQYETVETYPVPVEIVKALDYAAVAGVAQLQPAYHSMHLCTWSEIHAVHPLFQFCKWKVSLQEFRASEPFDLIYFDAFSPDKQPELWTAEVFQQMHTMMKPGARLVTYCSKSAVQRNMKAAGFVVSKLPGPPGKREMLVASN